MARPLVACRFTVGGLTVEVTVADGDELPDRRTRVADALRAAAAVFTDAAEEALATTSPTAPSEPAGPPVAVETGNEWDVVPWDDGSQRSDEAGSTDGRGSAGPDTGALVQADSRPHTGPPQAARLAELARRVAAARALGERIAPILAWGGMLPVQAAWPPPFWNQCWAVVRGITANDVGIYTQWRQGAALRMGADGAAYGFPSLGEARAFMQGTRLPCSVVRR